MGHRKSFGFTLVELLVVISIIALLIGILIPVLGQARETAKCVTELAAARSLAQAVIGRAGDHDGVIIPGYINAGSPTLGNVRDMFGEPAINIVAERYPWRLAEYLDYQIEGSMLVHEQTSLIELPPGVVPGTLEYFNWQYAISVEPSFGFNVNNVGGHVGPDGAFSAQNNPGLVSVIEEAVQPSRLIVFTSAWTTRVLTGENVPGNFRVTAPNDRSASFRWIGSEYDPDGDPTLTGTVHFRCNDNAVVSHLDGSASLFRYNELRDMTRWNNRAAELGDPDFSP